VSIRSVAAFVLVLAVVASLPPSRYALWRTSTPDIMYELQAQSASAQAVARDLQKKYDRVTDFSADFVHTYRGGGLKQQATESGHMLVK